MQDAVGLIGKIVRIKEIDYIIKDICKNYKHRVKNLYTLSGATEQRIKQMLEIIPS